MKDRAERAQQLDRHSRPVAQHLLGGRVGEQNLSLGVDDEHRLRHAVKGAAQHGGRKPEFVMGGDQMLGALGDRRFQRLVGGLGGARANPAVPGASGGSTPSARWRGSESARRRQDRSPAGTSRWFRIRRACAKSSLRSSATAFSRFPAIAAVAARSSWPTSAAAAALSPAFRSLINSPLTAIWRSTSALVSSISCFSVGIGLDGFDQRGERRQDRVAGLAVFPGEFLIAGQCEGPRRAFRPAQQRAHVGDFREYSERAVDGSVIGPRLEVQTDRGSADNEEDSEANSKDDTLRGHCRLLTSLFRVARGSFRCGDALIDRRSTARPA